MVWLLLAGLAIGAAVSFVRSRGNTVSGDDNPALPPAPLPHPLIALPPPEDWNNPEALMKAAKKANDAGLPETAKALASKAQETADVKQALESVTSKPLRSPIQGVTDKQWESFVMLYRGGDPAEISPNYCLGVYNIGFLRLRELGLASDVKQTEHGDRMVWQGKLKPPMTVKGFLANPALQYKVFEKDMKDRAALIREKYPNVLGLPLPEMPDVKVSLSGLLAVIKLAGTKGFHGWLTEKAQRERFKNTTAAFKTANGIF